MSHRRDRITDQAALWFVCAQEPDFSSAEREEFASWLAGSAEHVMEYLSLSAVSRDIREASALMDMDAIVALARESADEHNLVVIQAEGWSTEREPSEPTTPKRRRAVWLAAASVAIAALAGAWLFLTSGPVTYSTGVGEQTSFALEDGSVVILNAKSSLELHFTDTERTVRLLAGEALFDVEKDPDRLFQVFTKRALVRAVGTSFNVRQRGEATTVTVVEGIVDVRSLGLSQDRKGPSANGDESTAAKKGTSNKAESVRLIEGQQAVVDGRTAEVSVVNASVEKATSWRERRLVFDSKALSEVVAEFRLYNENGIVIEDLELSSTLISGAFDADDLESFGLFLSKTGIATVDARTDGTIVLRPPGDGP